VNRIEMLNRRFGSLLVIAGPHRQRTRYGTILHYTARCDCGRSKRFDGRNLRRGKVKSCGCQTRALIGAKSRRHGETGSPEFIAWTSMKNRCLNRNSEDYPAYGGRGIKVSDRWRHSFENFLADMGRRPSRHHSLHRKKNHLGYSPGNCVWATPAEQATNRRRYGGPSKVAKLETVIRDLIDAIDSGVLLNAVVARAKAAIVPPRKRKVRR
jgi:hypothetical protein